MRQSIGTLHIHFSFPTPFLCAFRNKPLSSLREPSQKTLAVTLRWDPPLNSWQETAFAHGRRRTHALARSHEWRDRLFFFFVCFFNLSILIKWEYGDILLWVHLCTSFITRDYEGLTATSNRGFGVFALQVSYISEVHFLFPLFSQKAKSIRRNLQVKHKSSGCAD